MDLCVKRSMDNIIPFVALHVTYFLESPHQERSFLFWIFSFFELLLLHDGNLKTID